jgi:hypothetical protein
LLSAGRAPGVEYLNAVAEVTQVGLGGAHHSLKYSKHVAQFSTDSLSIVTVFEPACVIKDAWPPRTSRVSWRNSALKICRI